MTTKAEESKGNATPVDALNEKLDSITKKGMGITKEWISMWSESLRYFFSDQLHGKKRHKDWEWVIVNYIWPAAMQEIAKLSRNHPKIIVNPWDDSDTDMAKTSQGMLQWQWRQGINGHGMRLEQIYGILDGKIFGYRVSKAFWEGKVEWDEQKKTWVGDVKHKLWHPAEFWADGVESVNDGNCGTQRFVPLEWAIARWPKFKKKLTEESTKYTETPSDGGGGPNIRGQISGAGYTSGTGDTDSGTEGYRASRLLNLITQTDKMTHSQKSDEEKVKVVKIEEIYLKDYEEVHRKEEEDIPAGELAATGQIYSQENIFYDSLTNKPFPSSPDKWPTRIVREYDEPKWPNGRYIIRVGHTILNPDPVSQRYPYPQWPFIVVPHYLLPHMWQGSDAVQLYKSHQDMINVSVSHLVNNMKFYGDPKIAVESGAIAINPRTKKSYKIGAGAGKIIRLIRGALTGRAPAIKVFEPSHISPAAAELYKLFAQEFKNATGLQSIAQGEQQPGEISATQANWLAISSNDRIQLQSVFEDEWIRKVCTQIARLCQDNYDVGRWIRIVGEDSTIGATQITQRMKEFRYDVDVLPATTLPYDEDKRIEKHLKAYELLLNPAPNPMIPEILRDLEVTDWRKVLQQHQGWVMFTQLLQLVEAVRKGEILPEEALRVLTNKIMQLVEQGQKTTPRPAKDMIAEKKENERERKEKESGTSRK